MSLSLRDRDAALLQERIIGWRRDPVLFVREAFQAEPDVWQARSLAALAQKNRLAIRSGHGVGKSTWDAWAILWMLTCFFPVKIPVTGSNFDQLRRTLWSEVGVWLKKMPGFLSDQWIYSSELLKSRYASEEAFAVCRTASKDRAQGLAGFHSDNIMVVVDEASAVDKAIFEVLRGALTSPNAKLIETGNPTQRSGDFFDAFHEHRALYHTDHISCYHSERVTQDWIDEQARLYGVDSNVFRVRVLGEFPKQEYDGVIPLDLIESAAGRDVAAIDVAPVWGVDVARFGDDKSTLAKRQGNVQLEPVKARSELDTEQVAGWILNEFLDTEQELRPSRICIDSIGVGAGVYDKLRRDRRFSMLGAPTAIVSVNVAESPPTKDRFERLRDELWWSAREWLQARNCRLCGEDQELMGELSSPKYEERADGRIRVESKRDMKARGVKSPDRADGWIHTFAGTVSASASTEDYAFRDPEPAVSDYDEHRVR